MWIFQDSPNFTNICTLISFFKHFTICSKTLPVCYVIFEIKYKVFQVLFLFLSLNKTNHFDVLLPYRSFKFFSEAALEFFSVSGILHEMYPFAQNFQDPHPQSLSDTQCLLRQCQANFVNYVSCIPVWKEAGPLGKWIALFIMVHFQGSSESIIFMKSLSSIALKTY